jgi:hypothetical protein
VWNSMRQCAGTFRTARLNGARFRRVRRCNRWLAWIPGS